MIIFYYWYMVLPVSRTAIIGLNATCHNSYSLQFQVPADVPVGRLGKGAYPPSNEVE